MADEYIPQFFNKRQFKIFIKVVDAMIVTPGQPALAPEKVAERMDNLLHDIDSPALSQMGRIMWLVNWLLPTLILKPGLFVNHDRPTRQRAIKKVIQKRGLFRDVARGLKVLSTVAYYSSNEGKTEVGYVEFDARPGTVGKNQDPIVHKDMPVV